MVSCADYEVQAEPGSSKHAEEETVEDMELDDENKCKFPISKSTLLHGFE